MLGKGLHGTTDRHGLSAADSVSPAHFDGLGLLVLIQVLPGNGLGDFESYRPWPLVAGILLIQAVDFLRQAFLEVRARTEATTDDDGLVVGVGASACPGDG